MHKLISKYATWGYFKRLMEIAQTGAVVFGVVFAIYQIEDFKRNELGNNVELTLKYYDRIMTGRNRTLAYAMDEGKPLLVSEGGKFTPEEIDDFLNNFEDLSFFWDMKMLDEEFACYSFSDITVDVTKNIYIQQYIRKYQQIDSAYFSGVDKLNHDFILSCDAKD